MNVQVAIDYAVGEGPTDLEDYVAQKDRVDGVLAVRGGGGPGRVGGRPAGGRVLLTGNVALPGWLGRRVQERVVDQRLGVRVQQASVAYLAPPDEVRGAFEEVNRAQTAAQSQEQRAHQEAARMAATPRRRPTNSNSRPSGRRRPGRRWPRPRRTPLSGG